MYRQNYKKGWFHRELLSRSAFTLHHLGRVKNLLPAAPTSQYGQRNDECGDLWNASNLFQRCDFFSLPRSASTTWRVWTNRRPDISWVVLTKWCLPLLLCVATLLLSIRLLWGFSFIHCARSVCPSLSSKVWGFEESGNFYLAVSVDECPPRLTAMRWKHPHTRQTTPERHSL